MTSTYFLFRDNLFRDSHLPATPRKRKGLPLLSLHWQLTELAPLHRLDQAQPSDTEFPSLSLLLPHLRLPRYNKPPVFFFFLCSI